MEILRLENVTFSYDNEKNVLEHINLSINEGEKIAFIGANGSGKSTLFLHLNGVLQADQGAIYLKGEKIEGKNRTLLRQHVGIVFQDADSQMIASTVKQEVAFGPMNMHLPMEEVLQRTEQAMADMHITDMADRPPHYLSGGEKKRVSIADILAMHSEVIIFDEPTASLDPGNQQVLEEVLQQLERENKTILMSNHDLDFVLRWADRVIVMGKDHLLADGTPIEVFSDQQVLDQANLKKPLLLQVHELLQKTGHCKQQEARPRNLQELEKLLILGAVCMLLAIAPAANAMHIMEGYLPPQYCVAWGVLCIPFLVGGFLRMKREVQADRKSITLLAMAGAFIFVISSLKIPSVTGSCSHMTGTGLGAILFSPSPVAILGIIVLLFQAILLAHGGLTTLGANTFSMAIAGPFLSYGIYRLCKKCRCNQKVSVFLAACLGDLFTYCVTSVQLALAYPSEAGGVGASVIKFLGVFAPTQLPLAIIEGILTVLIMMALETYAIPELKAIGFLGGGKTANDEE